MRSSIYRIMVPILVIMLFFIAACDSKPEVSESRRMMLEDTLRTDMAYADWFEFAMELMENYPQTRSAAQVTFRTFERTIFENDESGFRRLFSFLENYPDEGMLQTIDRIAIADRVAWLMAENMWLLDEAKRSNEFAIKLFEASRDTLKWVDEAGSSIYNNRGLIAELQEDPEAALEAFTLALSFLETSEVLLNRARILEGQERWAEALEDYVVALGQAPNQVMIQTRVRELHQIVEPGADTDTFMQDLMLSINEQRKEQVLAEIFNLPAPDYSFMDHMGRAVNNSSAMGKVVLLDFWATWCAPCRRELPEFQKVFEKYNTNPDIIFLAASTDREREKVKPYIQEAGYTFPYGFADEYATKFGVEGIPSLFIIGPNGNIRYKLVGYDPEKDFVQEISWRIESLLDT